MSAISTNRTRKEARKAREETPYGSGFRGAGCRVHRVQGFKVLGSVQVQGSRFKVHGSRFTP
jgi:hypothetical protein